MKTVQAVNPHTRRWSYEEYYQMADLGFFNGQRVELIDGEIIEMAPQRETHSIAIGLTQRALQEVFNTEHWIRVQMPVRLKDDAEPEPDIAILRGDIRTQAGKGHAFDPLLILEVAETTLQYDRKTKGSLYASASIQDYWIVNLADRQVEVHRTPQPDPAERFGWRYSEVQIFTSGQSVAPLAAPSSNIPVADLLP